eukprot:1159344-Pelagomonas_calceolata.AAC.10
MVCPGSSGAAVAATTFPHPACRGPRILPWVQASPAPKVMWVKLPGREEGVSTRLQYTHQEAAIVARRGRKEQGEGQEGEGRACAREISKGSSNEEMEEGDE